MMIWSNFSQSMVCRLAQGASVLLEVGERFLETLECVPHSAFDGVFWRTGDLGDLLEGEVGDVSEQEHFTLLVRQRFDRCDDFHLDLSGDRGALGRGSRVHVGDLFAERRAFAGLASLLIERGMTAVRRLAQVNDPALSMIRKKTSCVRSCAAGGILICRSTKLKSGVLCRWTRTENAARSPRW